LRHEPRSVLERMTGFEPVPQGLEGPQATVTPHSLWVGLRVSNASLHALQRGMQPPHSGRTWAGVAHRPIDICRLSKTPLLRAGGWQGNRTQSPPRGERGYGPSADHPLVPPVWRQRLDSNPDPRALEARMLPLHHAAQRRLTSWPCRRHTLPLAWPVFSYGLEAKTKKAF